MAEQTIIPRRALLMLGLAAMHLVCVSLSAFEVRPSDESIPGKTIARYGALTGADGTFGFFAPFVGTQLRLLFEVTDRAGQTKEESLHLDDNREISTRVANMVATFWFENEDLRRTLAASLAGKVLASHPEAESVAVRLDVLKMPTMAAYRQGDRPTWALHYRAKFVRRANRNDQGEAGK